ncbi:MAG: hypothetical protein ACLFVG_00280 [Candidatus Aminicenantes bacterium]
MAKCAKCKKRKAKRYCIALGESLCSLCCGLLREKEIHCPPDCTFLKQHKPYQEKRMVEKKAPSSPERDLTGKDILNDQRMAWLAFHIEMPLKEMSDRNTLFTDKDAVLALQYAKEKLIKGKGILLLPYGEMGPKNEAGEAIFKNMEECRYQRKVILPGEKDTYNQQEKIDCLDRIILSVKFKAKGNFDGHRYLQNLRQRFDRLEELSGEKKITPSSGLRNLVLTHENGHKLK